MLETVRQILINILDTLYKPFGYVVLTSILFMFVYLNIKEVGVKNTVLNWVQAFKTSVEFRKVFLLAFNTLYILFCTLFNRSVWSNPLNDVIGIWGIYNEKGELTTEALENLVLFIPFVMLVFWCFRERLIGEKVNFFVVVRQSVIIVFGFSFIIEVMQLLLRIGTFQLSDLFYNTLGGFIGGFIYWCGYKIIHRNNKGNVN